jgi:transcription elongation GreA/GreB family factor
MDEVIKRLVESGQIEQSSAETMQQMKPGAYCLSKSWGAGKILTWDIPGDRIEIDFEEKKQHSMKLGFAAKNLEPLPKEHFLAKFLDDPEAIKAAAKKDPAEVVRLILRGHGGKMHVNQLENLLLKRLVGPGQFKAWWDTARKKLKEDRRIVVPARRTDPILLRDESKSPAQSMVEDVLAHSDLKAKAKALSAILAGLDAFQDLEKDLEPVLDDLDHSIRKAMRLHLGQALELVLTRDELFEKLPSLRREGHVTIVEITQKAKDTLIEVTQALSIGGMRRIYESFPEAYGDDWVTEALRHLALAGPRRIAEIVRILLGAEKDAELDAFLAKGVQHRTLNCDILAWICKERKGYAAQVFAAELGGAIMNSIEQDHYNEVRRNNRLRELLVTDRDLVSDLLEGAELHEVRNFARRLRITPAYDQLTRNSLMARIIKAHPIAEDLVRDDIPKAEEKEMDVLIVSWESLEVRRKQLDDLVNVKIPANTKEIQLAKEHGDLRENFEYQAAKQNQKVLHRQRGLYEKEMGHARPTDFKDATSSQVAIGTIVDLKECTTGNRETYTILGAWDTDMEKHIISYLSATARALIGKKVGDIVSVGTGEDDETKDVEIVAIRKYATE